MPAKTSKKLNSTRRQKRALTIPAPGRKGNIKVTLEGWLNAARVALIEEGIGGVVVDRLATRLKVTRGGFYHHFKGMHSLLEALLDDWQKTNHFIPEQLNTSTVAAALASFQAVTNNLVHEAEFDPQYDLAIREWARISQPVADVVHTVDQKRIDAIRKIFIGFGYKPKDALIRARVMYWHQIGYYSIGVQETLEERESNVSTYMDVLGGEKYLAALRT